MNDDANKGEAIQAAAEVNAQVFPEQHNAEVLAQHKSELEAHLHPAGSQTSLLKSFEQWAAEKQSDVHMLAAARAMGRWAEGKELSEAEYDEALTKAATGSMA